jgi:hypothetical protein
MGVLVALVTCAAAMADGVTNSGDDLRDGWYPDQPRLSPDAVADSSFGQLWQRDVDGQVYGQPLVVGTDVIVVTENNKVYDFDSESGDLRWSRDLGAPFPARLIGPKGCADLTPNIGITSTPVVDTTTNTVYLTHKTYAGDPATSTDAAYYLDALDLASGDPRPSFPVAFGGVADNSRYQTFRPTTELQRPGLLLMNGTIYSGFGGHCDIPPYLGWVFGMDARTGATKARWATGLRGIGAGIWQSGSGLMSDGPGRIFASTGNGFAPDHPQPAPGDGNYGESIVRLAVQPDGKLRPMDFFAPSDAAKLDDFDADFASGGITALTDNVFGTIMHPHMSVAVGKAGYVYLLDRDDLGGFQQAPGGDERVVERVGPFGGVWSRPGVWPGDGGWISVPTASPATGDTPNAGGSTGKLYLFHYRIAADGTPTLDTPVASDDAFGFGSSAPVITSDGTASGSATMWTIWMAGGSGANAQLRAYDAVPVNGHINLRRSFPIGTASKFTTPGVGPNGRVYVGTRDGHVLAFGAPVAAPVRAPATTFPTTTVGETSTANVTLTFSGTVNVQSITASGAGYTARPDAAAVPGTFTNGHTLTVPVDFTPAAASVAGGSLNVVTDTTTYSFSLTGTGQGTDPELTTSPPVVSFGGAIVGDQRASTITIGNAGGRALHISAVDLPGAPFTIDNAPVAGQAIGPGDAINLVVHYRPTAVGDFADALGLQTDGGDREVGLTGSAGVGPKIAMTPAGGWSFGTVTVGQSAEATVRMVNTGDSAARFNISKPPLSDGLENVSEFFEGATIQPGETRDVTLRWTPSAPGALSDSWTLNPGDGSGKRDVPVTGTAVAAEVPPTRTDPDPGTDPVVPPPVVGVTPPAVVVPPPPAITPPSVGRVRGDGPVVVPTVRSSGLRVTRLRLAAGSRRLAVSVTVARGVRGPVGVTLKARVGRRVVTVVTATRLTGRTRFAFSITLPKTIKKWTRIALAARFPGSATVRPAVATMVLVRGR